jgi:hypothetical protein
MPDGHDKQYQVQSIERKLLLIGGYERLTETERAVIEYVLDTHQRQALSYIPCAICGAPMTDNGKCPNRAKEGHGAKKEDNG